MIKRGLIVLFVSIAVLILSCIGWGFKEQINSTGFNSNPLLTALTTISLIGVVCAVFIIAVGDDW